MPFATHLHESSIIVDAACPGEHWRQHRDTWISGGATCCSVSVGAPGAAADSLYDIARIYRLIRSGARLVLATRADDIVAAKSAGQLAVVLHFQGTQPIEYEADLIEPYSRLGVRVVQLAYKPQVPGMRRLRGAE